jgi:hypothetical protein
MNQQIPTGKNESKEEEKKRRELIESLVIELAKAFGLKKEWGRKDPRSVAREILTEIDKSAKKRGKKSLVELIVYSLGGLKKDIEDDEKRRAIRSTRTSPTRNIKKEKRCIILNTGPGEKATPAYAIAC